MRDMLEYLRELEQEEQEDRLAELDQQLSAETAYERDEPFQEEENRQWGLLNGLLRMG